MNPDQNYTANNSEYIKYNEKIVLNEKSNTYGYDYYINTIANTSTWDFIYLEKPIKGINFGHGNIEPLK